MQIDGNRVSISAETKQEKEEKKWKGSFAAMFMEIRKREKGRD